MPVLLLSFLFGCLAGYFIIGQKYKGLCNKIFFLFGGFLILLMGLIMTISRELRASMKWDIVYSVFFAAAVILGSLLFSFIPLLFLKKNSSGIAEKRQKDPLFSKRSLFPALKLVGVNIALITAGALPGLFINNASVEQTAADAMKIVLILFIGIVGGQCGAELKIYLFAGKEVKNSSKGHKGLRSLVTVNNVLIFMALPLAVILGSLAGAALLAPFLGMGWKDGMLVAAPLGWQSMGGPLIMELTGPRLGSLAFMTNTFRDIFSLIVIPLAGHSGMKLLALAPGGSSTMDILLPATINSIGRNNIILAMWIGAVCAFWAPVLIHVIAML
ncbi:MAG: lysine exporter LysO family protein [bacterium]|nr:lysine exporter LysO family protein [bacterium]